MRRLGLVVGLLLLIAGVTVHVLLYVPGGRPFDREAWIGSGPSRWERWRMAQTVASEMSVGQSRAAVIERLGAPDEEWDGVDGPCHSYDLGDLWFLGNSDSRRIVVSYDREDRVQEVDLEH